jgi:hypothetical protein
MGSISSVGRWLVITHKSKSIGYLRIKDVRGESGFDPVELWWGVDKGWENGDILLVSTTRYVRG